MKPQMLRAKSWKTLVTSRLPSWLGDGLIRRRPSLTFEITRGAKCPLSKNKLE